MTMLFLQGLLNDKLINALCWTLLHSLWQGLLFSIIAAFILIMTRQSKPALRYNVFTVLLLLFIATAGMTFIREIIMSKEISPAPVKSIVAIPRSVTADQAIDAEVLSTTVAPTYFDSALHYLNTHALLIVAIWFVLFSFKLLKMVAAIRYMRYISDHKTFEPAFYWKQRILELAKTLRIQYPVTLLESAIIKVPMVVGMIKPVILIPVGLLSNFPPEQIEAALLHELAHIRRNDYLVNLLQSFTEIVFFFNPAVHWLASLIREERENCCDDIAIGCIKNKKQFIHALVAFQEYTMLQSNKSIAIAFAGQKKYLLNRVRRIIYNENKKLNAMEKGIFIFSIVATSLIGFATAKQSSTDNPFSPAPSLTAAVTDTIPATQGTKETGSVPGSVEFKSINSISNHEDDFKNRIVTAIDKNGKIYKLVEKNDELVELYVDDKKIPSGELSNYENIIKHIEEEVELREKTMQGKLKKDQAEQGQKIAKLDAERNELLQKLSELDQEKAKLGYEKDKQLWDHEWENAANSKTFDLLLNLKQDNQVRFDSLKNDELAPLLYDKLESLKKMDADNLFQQKLFNNKNLEDLNNNYLDKLTRENLDQQHQTELLNEKLGLLNNAALEQHQYHTYILIDPIIQDMVEQKIIPRQQEELSFELNNNSFIVNDKKQPAEIHERFRKKYIKKSGDYFRFSRKNGNTSTSIKQDCDKPE